MAALFAENNAGLVAITNAQACEGFSPCSGDGLQINSANLNSALNWLNQQIAGVSGNTSVITLGTNGLVTHDDGNGGITTFCVPQCTARPWFVERLIPVGETATISPTQNDTFCEDETPIYTIQNEVDCQVTINADGTHDVEVLASACANGGWSYEYTAECPSTGDTSSAPVSGLVDSGTQTLALSINETAGNTADLEINMSDGSPIDIDWGDGTVDVGIASGMLTSHVYAADFAGDVIITYSNCGFMETLISQQGAFNFMLDALPDGLLQLVVQDRFNTVSGDIANLPLSLTLINVGGDNTISGNVSSLRPAMEFFIILGDTTLTGDITNVSNAAANLRQFRVGGTNTISGTMQGLATAPLLEDVFVLGNNTLGGTLADISTLPLTAFRISGANTITGDVANFPNSLVDISIQGANTIFGDIANIPPNMTVQFTIQGNTTLTGDIAAIPATLQQFQVEGANTLSGDTVSISPPMLRFNVQGNNTITALTNTWNSTAPNWILFTLTGVGMPQAQVDNILSALTNVPNWISSAAVGLGGANAAPSAAGVADVAIITGNGATVVTN